MDRRELFRVFGIAGAALSASRLTGCGSAGEWSATSASKVQTRNRHVTVYNLTMEGWSTLGSGHLGDLDQPLLATQLRDFVDLVNQSYTQDPHGHRFTLTQADMAKILLGQEARILTTYALDHRHEVRIKLSHHFDRRPPLDLEIDEAGHPVSS